MPKKLRPLNFHPLCKLMPEMTPVEFEELCQDVRLNGVRVPVVVVGKDEIIDGRSRYMAAQVVDRPCPRVEYVGDSTLEGLARYVISANCKRRELTAAQKGAAALALLEWCERNGCAPRKSPCEDRADPTRSNSSKPDGQTRKDTCRDRADPTRSNSSKAAGQKQSHTTQKEAAEAAGASERAIKIAARAKRECADIYEAMQSGQITAAEAERALDAMKSAPPEKTEPSALPRDSRGKEIAVPELAGILDVNGEIVKRFAALRNDCIQLHKKINALREETIGRYLGPETAEKVKAAGEDLKFATPWTTCVYCEGRCNCKACGHERATVPGPAKGWITKLIYSHAPESMR